MQALCSCCLFSPCDQLMCSVHVYTQFRPCGQESFTPCVHIIVRPLDDGQAEGGLFRGSAQHQARQHMHCGSKDQTYLPCIASNSNRCHCISLFIIKIGFLCFCRQARRGFEAGGTGVGMRGLGFEQPSPSGLQLAGQLSPLQESSFTPHRTQPKNNLRQLLGNTGIQLLLSSLPNPYHPFSSYVSRDKIKHFGIYSRDMHGLQAFVDKTACWHHCEVKKEREETL